MTIDALQRLEDWRCGHKARAVQINHDSGFGASCWEVQLQHEHGTTTATATNFFGVSRADAARQGLVIVMLCDDDNNELDESDGDWPGPAATINAALDAFANGIWISESRHGSSRSC